VTETKSWITEADRAKDLPSRDDDCDLCVALKLTPWLYEDEECWIAECMICATPMVVWKPHGMPDDTTEARLLARMGEIADTFYEGKGWWADGNRRNIPEHWHCHARPAGGFFGNR
jgi:hypothetical protein